MLKNMVKIFMVFLAVTLVAGCSSTKKTVKKEKDIKSEKKEVKTKPVKKKKKVASKKS